MSKNEAYLRGKALSLVLSEKYLEAINCFEEALKINPNNEKMRQALKLAAVESMKRYKKNLKAKKMDKAQYFSECLINATSLGTIIACNGWYFKGVVLGRLGKYLEALKCFDKAVEMLPNVLPEEPLLALSVWTDRGNTYYRLGRYSEALLSINKALEINPKSKNAKKLKKLCLDYIKDS